MYEINQDFCFVYCPYQRRAIIGQDASSVQPAEKKIATTWEVYSVIPDQVPISNPYILGYYNGKLQTNLTSYFAVLIGGGQTINSWVTTLPSPYDSLSELVDVTDANQVGLVKFELENGVPVAVVGVIAGDAQL